MKIVDELSGNRVLVVSTDSSLNDSEGKPPTLGFYMNDETSGSSGMITIQLFIWRALTCPDTVLSKYIERRALILNLFSAFIWAITDYVSAEDFHPTTVTCFREVYTAFGVELFPLLDSDYRLPSRQHPQLKSDKIKYKYLEREEAGGNWKEGKKVVDLTFGWKRQLLRPKMSGLKDEYGSKKVFFVRFTHSRCHELTESNYNQPWL